MRGNKFDATYWGLLAYAVLCLTSMALMSVGAAIVIACVVFDRGGPRVFVNEVCQWVRSSRVARVYLRASAALISACVASLVWAHFEPLTFAGQAMTIHWSHELGKMWYFAFPLPLAIGWRRLAPKLQGEVLRAWILCFGVLSAMGILQFFTGLPRAQPNPLLPGYYHPILFLGHHLSVASVWIFPFFVAVDAVFDRGLGKALGLPRRILGVFLACALFTLIFGYSRTLWVALPVALAFWALLRLPLRWAAAGAAALLVAGFAFSRLPIVEQRLENPMGVGERVELWKANVEFFKHRPVLGVGFGQNQDLSYSYFLSIHPGQTDFFVGHAHSIFLEVLSGTGLVGAAAWLFWVGTILWALLLALKKRKTLAPPLLAAWMALLINGVTQVNFWEGKVLHQIMWSVGMVLGLL